MDIEGIGQSIFKSCITHDVFRSQIDGLTVVLNAAKVNGTQPFGEEVAPHINSGFNGSSIHTSCSEIFGLSWLQKLYEVNVTIKLPGSVYV